MSVIGISQTIIAKQYCLRNTRSERVGVVLYYGLLLAENGKRITILTVPVPANS